MRVISTFEYKGKEYIVVDTERSNEFGYRYGTIDSELVENGRLTKTVNGLQMALGKTVADAIQLRMEQVAFKEMRDTGMSYEEIAMKIMEGK